ncbi:cyclic nucleotide-binding domain-containing protein [Streptomyces sp. NPDC005438]|uniref:cyclic nucleotide-binding domain-containing protein n=1 Tax=Streptomyces sp. NPDC005438 TaxID=3156880 RepID=UPI0033ABFF23
MANTLRHGFTARHGLMAAVPPNRRDSLMALSRQVSFPTGTRIFDEGGPAEQFWIVHTGSVALEMRLPGRRPLVLERVGISDLLGWSWLLPPHRWHVGAQAETLVRAWEFDAQPVRDLCKRDRELGMAVLTYVAGVTADRLMAARTRLLDALGPYGASGRLSA